MVLQRSTGLRPPSHLLETRACRISMDQLRTICLTDALRDPQLCHARI